MLVHVRVHSSRNLRGAFAAAVLLVFSPASANNLTRKETRMKLVRYGPAGKEKPGLDRRRRQTARPVAQGQGHQRGDARTGRTRQAAQARYQEAADRQRQAAPRTLRGDAVEVRRDRPQLRRPRQGVRQSDSRASGRLLQVPDVHRRAQRQHHAAARFDAHRLGSRTRMSSSAAPRDMSRSRTRSNTSPATA